MKTILIDPFARTITQIECGSDIESIYKVLGCSLIEAVYPNHRSRVFDDVYCLFVDEEGLLKHPRAQAFFGFQNQPLEGKAIFVNMDGDGDTVGTSLTVEEITPFIKWLGLPYTNYRT